MYDLEYLKSYNGSKKFCSFGYRVETLLFYIFSSVRIIDIMYF